MSFDPTLFRSMPPVQYGDSMTCPITGLVIPKSPAANVAWRQGLIKASKTSASARRAIRAACSASPIYWLNAFGWTFLQKKIALDGKEVGVVAGNAVDGVTISPHIPFITWKVQDEALMSLVDAIDNGHDALMHKSRDMGGTWLVVAAFQHYFQFRPSTTFLELSRKEVLVDRRGDMDSLFEKHRYLLKMQPEWLRPQRVVDNSLHLENRDNGSTIEGESTNENAGQASRKTAVFIDEAARIRDLAEIDLATADTTACRIFNSTPQGPNTHFTRLYRQFSAGTRSGKLILLPWWMHPDKARGASIETIDGKEEVVSPWKKDQKERRSSRNVAQNIDGEHGKSGDSFFDADEIERHRKAHQADPLLTGDIKWLNDYTEEERERAVSRFQQDITVFVEQAVTRPWRLWVPLIDGRPNQLTRYVFGIDISNGSGASNSVITVIDHTTGMIVAKFWDAFTSPEELAEIAARAALWFGGRKPPLIAFEKNGPGLTFGKKLVTKLKYGTVYYQDVIDQKSRQKTSKWGWHSSDAKKQILLGEYREDLRLNRVINPCREALDEAIDYVYDDNGRIEPGSNGVEEGGGRALHGDHVIADAIAQMARKDVPDKEKPEQHVAPSGSFAQRREAHRRQKLKDQAWAR